VQPGGGRVRAGRWRHNSSGGRPRSGGQPERTICRATAWTGTTPELDGAETEHACRSEIGLTNLDQIAGACAGQQMRFVPKSALCSSEGGQELRLKPTGQADAAGEQ
jgi:hypothetical protein